MFFIQKLFLLVGGQEEPEIEELLKQTDNGDVDFEKGNYRVSLPHIMGVYTSRDANPYHSSSLIPELLNIG